MARNLDEPGANFNQLLELSLKLQNARTFAGTVADASTEMEQYPDTYLRPGETLEDWTGHYFRKPNAAGGRVGFNEGGSLQDILRRYWQGMGPWGKGSTGAFYFSDLYDALAPYLGMFNKGGRVYGKYAQQLASGGRVGYQEGKTVLPKAKPSEEEIKKIKWRQVLNVLKKAKGGMGHRSWLNFVSEHLDDGLKAGIISKEQFNRAIIPLFGQAGEVHTRALEKDDSIPVKDLLELHGEKREDSPAYLLAKGGRVGLFGGGPPGVHGKKTGGGYSDKERHERRQSVKGPPGGGDPGMTYQRPTWITKKKYPPSLSSPTLREEARKKREEAAFEAMWRGAPPSMGEREKMFRKHRTARLLEEKRISDFAKKITEREKLYPYTDMTEEEFSKKYSKVYDFMKKDPNWNWEEFQKVSFANPGETFQATGARDIGLPLGATDTRDIDLFMTPFEKTNLEMTTAGPKYGYKKIMSDQDKAQVALHEMRHKKILTEPILTEAQPPLAVEVSDMKGTMGVGPQQGESPLMYRHLNPPGSKNEFSHPLDMHEVFTRFMDRQYGHLKTPSGPYFDKIWRDEWQPYADKYENILTEYDLSPVNLAGGGRVPLNKGTTPYNAETLSQELRGIGSLSLPTSYGVEPDINKYYEDKKAKGGRVGLVTGSGDYAKEYLKYADKATQDKFNKLVNELSINMSFESAISLALSEIREGSD